jgi:SAM-dependent methyltransferase
MYITEKARNILRSAIQRYGPPRIKRSLWNAEFMGGRWDCLDDTPGDCVYPYVEKYAANGSILDLGCGSGSTANELATTSYRDYVGVDISDVAIGKAIKRTEKNRRADKSRFFQSDFFSYMPAEQYSVILFRDSIYYVPMAKIKVLLVRYAKYLQEHGVFVVRLWAGSDKDKAIVDIIESNFDVVERYLSDKPKQAVIVFR